MGSKECIKDMENDLVEHGHASLVMCDAAGVYAAAHISSLQEFLKRWSAFTTTRTSVYEVPESGDV